MRKGHQVWYDSGMRIYRDADNHSWIEIPGAPGKFAQSHEFSRGQKYVKRWWCTEEEIQKWGPLTLEFSDDKPAELDPK